MAENEYAIAIITPPKTNVEPENGPLEKEIHFGNHPFQLFLLNLSGL